MKKIITLSIVGIIYLLFSSSDVVAQIDSRTGSTTLGTNEKDFTDAFVGPNGIVTKVKSVTLTNNLNSAGGQYTVPGDAGGPIVTNCQYANWYNAYYTGSFVKTTYKGTDGNCYYKQTWNGTLVFPATASCPASVFTLNYTNGPFIVPCPPSLNIYNGQ